jgi:hypothetical protein
MKNILLKPLAFLAAIVLVALTIVGFCALPALAFALRKTLIGFFVAIGVFAAAALFGIFLPSAKAASSGIHELDAIYERHAARADEDAAAPLARLIAQRDEMATLLRAEGIDPAAPVPPGTEFRLIAIHHTHARRLLQIADAQRDVEEDRHPDLREARLSADAHRACAAAAQAANRAADTATRAAAKTAADHRAAAARAKAAADHAARAATAATAAATAAARAQTDATLALAAAERTAATHRAKAAAANAAAATANTRATRAAAALRSRLAAEAAARDAAWKSILQEAAKSEGSHPWFPKGTRARSQLGSLEADFREGKLTREQALAKVRPFAAKVRNHALLATLRREILQASGVDEFPPVPKFSGLWFRLREIERTAAAAKTPAARATLKAALSRWLTDAIDYDATMLQAETKRATRRAKRRTPAPATPAPATPHPAK